MGLSFIRFNIGAIQRRPNVGVLAQDLLNSENSRFRHAVVVRPDGYYAVKYDDLGLKMLTLDEWRAVNVESCCLPEAHSSFVEDVIGSAATTQLVFVAH